MKIQFLLILILFLAGCRRSSESKDEKNLQDSLDLVAADTLGTRDGTADNMNDSPDKNAYAEFTLTNGPVVLRVRDWRRNMNLPSLGAANDTLTRELTIGSDTHQGSTVTEYKYDDLNLEFFTPKGSDDAWLMTADIKGGPWATARGIKVGDSVTDMKSMYPSAINNDPDKTVFVYNVDDSVLTFATAGDKVTGIKVQYNIP